MREPWDLYKLVDQHPEAFKASANLAEFIEATGMHWLDGYVGYWADDAFATAKAGKRTHRPLIFPNANKYTDLFKRALFLPTDDKNKPPEARFLGGNDGFARHCGGKRGWSTTTPDIPSHYGAKFYGTYVIPLPEVARVVKPRGGYTYSFEAIKREDGILITINRSDYIGCDWAALLDVTEDIRTMFDDETKAFLDRERQAELDAWNTTRF